jgi:hypothetical protein
MPLLFIYLKHEGLCTLSDSCADILIIVLINNVGMDYFDVQFSESTWTTS